MLTDSNSSNTDTDTNKQKESSDNRFSNINEGTPRKRILLYYFLWQNPVLPVLPS
jgi:hypothetical protein